MLKSDNFQLDITDSSSWSLYHRLQSVFSHANPANPDLSFQAVSRVLSHRNVVDESQHQNSPYRNRPAYLDSGAYDHLNVGTEIPAFERPTSPPEPKDWNAESKFAALAQKDWSKLGL